MIIAAKAALGGTPALPYRWVGVGTSGFLATSDSTTASSWTTRTSSFGTTGINQVRSNGTSIYVAVGDAGKLATSPDAVTWTQRTSSFGTDNIEDVAFGNSIWVAVGWNGKLATATDPTGTWTQRTTGFSGTVPINGIYYGNGLWVAINNSGEIRTAPDPTGTWTVRTSTLTLGTKVLWCPAQNIWVAGGDTAATGALASSTDGLTWTARNLNVAPTQGGIGFASNSSVILYNFLDAGFNTDIETSTNGTTWTNRTPARTNIETSLPGVDGSGFIVIGSTANFVQTTSDGTTYTSRTGPTTACNSIQHSSGL